METELHTLTATIGNLVTGNKPRDNGPEENIIRKTLQIDSTAGSRGLWPVVRLPIASVRVRSSVAIVVMAVVACCLLL